MYYFKAFNLIVNNYTNISHVYYCAKTFPKVKGKIDQHTNLIGSKKMIDISVENV